MEMLLVSWSDKSNERRHQGYVHGYATVDGVVCAMVIEGRYIVAVRFDFLTIEGLMNVQPTTTIDVGSGLYEITGTGIPRI